MINIFTRYLVILVKNKEDAKRVFSLVSSFLMEKLILELNERSRYYPSRFGCDFCGFVIHEDYVLLRKRNKNKFRKKIKKWNSLYEKDLLDRKKFEMSYASFLGYMKWADSYKFIDKYLGEINFEL